MQRVGAVALFAGLALAGWAEEVSFTQNSDPAGVFAETVGTAEVGTFELTQAAPLSSGTFSFTHWTLNGVRQDAGDGQALIQPGFTVLGTMVATAHYLPTAEDSNANQIPDWQEIRFYGGLVGEGPAYNHEGDPFSHEEELTRGYGQNTVDEIENGGIAMGFGALATVRDWTFYKRVEVRSEPPGIFPATVDFLTVGSDWTSQVPPSESQDLDYRFLQWEVSEEGGPWQRQPETGPAAPQAMLTNVTAHHEVRAVYELIDYKQITIRSEPVGLFPTTQDRAETGTDWLSGPAPVVADYSFAQWEVKGSDGQWRRQPAAGLAYPQALLMAVSEDLELRAVYLLTAENADGDALPDWQELQFFGTLAWTENDGDDELDADGLTTAEELIRGYAPHVKDEIENGGVAMGFGKRTTVRDLGAWKRLEIRSEPAGLFPTTIEYVPAGANRITDAPPATAAGYSFAQWEVKGADGQWRRQPATGLAYGQVVLSNISEDLEVRAVYLRTSENSDGDALADWQELQFFGALTWTENDGDDELDADGLTTAEELERGYAPYVKDEIENGGVAMGFGKLSTVQIPASFKRLEIRSLPLEVIPTVVEFVPPGADRGTDVPPPTAGDLQFVQWDVKGEDGEWRRQPENGPAVQQVQLTNITEDLVVRALYLPSDADTYLLVTASEPEGMFPTAVEMVAVGEDRLSLLPPATVGTYSFAHWRLRSVNGPWVRQPASGFAYRQIALSNISESLELQAVYLPTAQNSDGDALPDWQELQFFGNLDLTEGSDGPDADGLSIEEELERGYAPTVKDEIENGGVAMGFSKLTRRGQFFVSQPFVLQEGLLTEYFANIPWQAGEQRLSDLWEDALSSVADEEQYPVLGDFDGDGDYELFVYESHGVLNAFENIGSSFVVNLSDRSGLFGALGPALQLVPPELLGVSLAEWDGDGDEELIWAYNLGDPPAAQLLVLDSPGSFGGAVPANTSVVVLPDVSPQRYRAAALGDVNGDGLADLVAGIGDENATVELRVYERDPVNGFGSSAQAVLDLSGQLSGREHVSLSISRAGEESGKASIYLASLYGQILRLSYEASSSTLAVERTDWAASYPGLAQVPRIAVEDWDGDGDSDLVASFVDVDGDSFVAPPGGGGEGGPAPAHKPFPFVSRLLRSNDPRLAAPFELTATNGARSILVEWTPNREYQLDGYFIYRSTSAAGPWTLIRALPTDQRRFVDQDGGLLGGVDYYYQVTAITRVWSPGSVRPALYEGPPSVSNAARVENPLFVLGEPSRLDADTILLPVSAAYAAGISGFELELHISYDKSWLSPTTIETTAASADLVYSDNLATADGEVVITGTGGSLEGAGLIFLVHFDEIAAPPAPGQAPSVPGGPQRGIGIPDGIFVLDVIKVRDLGNELLVVSPPSQVELFLAQMGLSADVNLDGMVNQDDVTALVSRIIQARQDPASASSILPVSDLNGTGTLDVGDIPLLYQRIAQGGSTGEPDAGDYEVSVVETNGRAGSLMKVPLALNDASGLSAVYLQINYDPNVLQYERTQRPAASLGENFEAVSGEEDGVIYVILYRDSSLAGGSGTLVDLEFRVNGGAQPGMAADVVVAEVGLASDSGARAWWNSTVEQGATRMWVTLSDKDDSDGDGVSDFAEQFANGRFDYDPFDPVRNPFGRDTIFNSADTDGDGFLDGWEARHGWDRFGVEDLWADTDADGTLDFYEQAFGSDPLVADEAPRGIGIIRENGMSYPAFSYLRLKSAQAGVNYAHEVSGDLEAWFSGVAHTEELGVQEYDALYDEVSSRDRTAVEVGEGRFSRVKATREEP